MLTSDLKILNEMMLDLARSKVINFAKFTKEDYEINWHHKKICSALDKMVTGETKRLMIFMPPRTGKSELVSRRFPAFLLGKKPDTQIIAASYSADLASRMNRDVQRIIDDEKYSMIFPETKLFGKNIRSVANGSWLRNSDIFEVVGHRGVYRSAGVGGGITGMGANFAIIDDPIKDQKEADSPTFRQNVWDWFTSTLLTRLEKDACILITLTRWHEDDLAGRILAQPDHGFEIVNFPMIKDSNDDNDPREIGDVLWPNKYDADACAEIRRSTGARVWSSLYQQRPTALEGGIFKRSWFKFYNALPDRFDEIIDSWDLPFKDTSSSDFAVGQKWGRVGGRFYLIDLVRGRMDFPAAHKAITAFRSKRIPNVVLIEDKANGAAIISTLKDDIPGVIGFSPDSSKEARAHSVSAMFEAGNVYFPHDSPWLSDYLDEMVNFPRARNDDQVDSTVQALIRFARHGNGDFTKSMSKSRIKTVVSPLGSRDLW